MADALASGASVRKDVGVQVPPRPQVALARSRSKGSMRLSPTRSSSRPTLLDICGEVSPHVVDVK